MKNWHFLSKSPRGQIWGQTDFTRPDWRPESQTDLLEASTIPRRPDFQNLVFRLPNWQPFGLSLYCLYQGCQFGRITAKLLKFGLFERCLAVRFLSKKFGRILAFFQCGWLIFKMSGLFPLFWLFSRKSQVLLTISEFVLSYFWTFLSGFGGKY